MGGVGSEAVRLLEGSLHAQNELTDGVAQPIYLDDVFGRAQVDLRHGVHIELRNPQA